MNYCQVSRAVYQHGKTLFLAMPRQLTSTCVPPELHEILQDEKKQQFYIPVGDRRAYIQYKKLNGDFHLVYTEVPSKFRGTGLAAALAQGTFFLIKEKNVHMKLSCDYLISHYKRNQCKEFEDLLVPEQRNSL